MEAASTSQETQKLLQCPRPKSDLCTFCQGINLEDLKSRDGYTHQPTGSALTDSADTCALCRLIVNVLKRCIHERRFATSRIRDISDILSFGPVSMFAAGRDLDSKTPWAGSRELGPVCDGPLSQRVTVTLGVAGETLRYGMWSAVLLMFTDPGSFPESMGIVSLSGPTERIQDDPICDLNISRTLKWAEECEKHHDQCNGSYPWFRVGSAVAPTRLLDVGQSGHPSVRLVSTKGQRLEYAALSYYWGDRHSGLLTTDENIKWMTTTGAPLTLLSQTIQDAVIVVRRLEIAYLWVDALCIIQEQSDQADWRTESGKMGMIYANAYLTIAATSAVSASQGFLISNHRFGVPVDFKARKVGPCNGKIYFREYTMIMGSFEGDVECSPLLNRAWVKQERMLSRRTVDFSSRQIYWTCRQSRHSEDDQKDGEGAVNAAAILQNLGIFGISRSAPEEQRSMLHGLFFRLWADLVEEYSALQLKFESDRLPALAGIVGILKQSVPGRYLSGIWEANLTNGLLWTPAPHAHPVQRSTQARVPSWSWASVISPVSAGGHSPEDAQVRFLGTSVHETGRPLLRLQGRLHRCSVQLDPRPASAPCRSDRKLKDPRIEIPTYEFALDAAVGPRPPGERFSNTCRFDGTRGAEINVYALGLSLVGPTLVGSFVGLLLRKLDGPNGEAYYERVGKMWSSDRFWYSLQDTSIQLI